ncbi:PREDICTED: apoptotic protease-activating factor 1 isoform X2 [Vollenhovia emeryi]|uniref:apoptotic protease-activating factor 1 isoform X2 n=1 Tax=Vollenhovia emeryi TaxID=411798 RepID=UPI0005F4AEE8|nr:PREDICTED: apoptotic protease-activating factor 1 isoform X2 [Vollenhovia emeryi]
MERSHREILIRLRGNIIDDLDVDNDVIQTLRNEYILREEDVKHIYTGATKEERAIYLLDLLPLCGPSAFDVFHLSLKHHYEWLSDEIDKLLGNYEIEANGEIDYYAGPPNIPPLSPLTVTREEKLRTALQQLTSREYIALHGMKGFGKSCLVASTLKDVKLVKDLFSNQVYWIKFSSNRLIDEEILIQLNTLYHNVRNLEIVPELFTPLKLDDLIQYLELYFNKQDNCNALLILDDVYDKKIIKTFDFKCKTLVLTADIDVLERKRSKIIQMNDGFTEAETLGLFAKVLEMDVNKLPIEAKQIHEECKGMPLLIAMFAAQFEEFKMDMQTHSKRWKYYLKSLRKKDATTKVMREFLEKQETIFDICIEQLKPDLKKYYESLAIFCEDVNITPKTLEIFWQRDIFQVEELMLDLCHKSLAAKKWNNDLKTYIYGVHDLLLCHLRKKRTDSELMQMHETIVKNYRTYCNNDFSKLPNDNYIYSYIGYHLDQANLFKEFQPLYTNFDFIQAKLIHASVNDLLLDLKKYRIHITYDKEDCMEKVSDIESFLQMQASIIVEHKRKKCLDIIQIAMDHPYEGYISQTAKYLAMTKPEYLYLSHKKSFQYFNKPVIEEMSADICTSSFTDYPELILTGNTSGKIILWDFESKQQKIFNGHRKGFCIKKVLVSTAGDCFISLSDAGIIKLFPLFNEKSDIDYSINLDSPRQRQNSWSGFFANLDGQDDSLLEFCVENEKILDMAFGHEDKYIAACTDKATIQLWDRDGEVVFTVRDSTHHCISKIAFTANGSLLHIMDQLNGAIVLYSNCGNDNTTNTTYQYIACYNLQLKSAAKEVIFFHHIPNHKDSLIVVTQKEAVHVKWWWGHGCVRNFAKQPRGFVDNDTVTYVCATITHDGKYIIMADSAGFINVWNTYSGYQPIATYKSRVTSLDSYWLSDEGYHIICGNGNSVLYKWKFPVQESNDLPRKCVFDAIVESCDQKDIVVKESPSDKLIVSCGEDTVEEHEFVGGRLSSLQLSADGKQAVYVTNNNNIQLLDIITGSVDHILTLEKPIQFVKIMNLRNYTTVLCRWKDNNLKIWQRNRPIFGIDTKAEPINDIHKIDDNYVVTVTQKGVIALWYISIPWGLISEVALPPSSCISFSCLSHCKNYLAILSDSQLTLFYIIHEFLTDALNTSSAQIKIGEQPCFTHCFAQKVTCCDISKNEQYVAVGFESGQISIIDIQNPSEIYCQLSFHTNPITQLYWAPAAINVPILLSLTNDELVWWNIALAKNNMKNRNNMRRSRMGLSHSTSTPSFNTNTLLNLRMSNSRSIDTGVSNLQDVATSSTAVTNTISNISRYWIDKVGKNREMPELLLVVESPPNRDAKVCISPDFSKFVMVDMYGSTNTFKLIEPETMMTGS